MPGLFRSLTCHVFHHIRRGPSSRQFLYHEFHRPVDMREEHPVAFAEVVKTGFTIRSYGEPVLLDIRPGRRREQGICGSISEVFPVYPARTVFACRYSPGSVTEFPEYCQAGGPGRRNGRTNIYRRYARSPLPTRRWVKIHKSHAAPRTSLQERCQSAGRR